MTAPTGTGRAVTLQPGAAPVMLTEYAATADPAAALQIINSNVTAGRVWISSDGSVGPAAGVPLDAGTSIPWATPGQVWAVLDPAATAPVTLTLTSAISDWTPSPAAIAAEVAAQLLAQGVPNVLTETVLYNDTVPLGGVALDVHGYASVVISVLAGAGSYQHFLFQDGNGNPIGQNDVAAGNFAGTLLPVVGPTLFLQPSGYPIMVVGSNRLPPAPHPVAAGFSSEPWVTTFAGSTVAGQTLNWTPSGNSATAFQGPAIGYFQISSTIKGYWVARTARNDAFIADTGQGHAAPNGATAVQCPVALPANTQQIGFLAETTSAGVIGAAYLIPNY